MSLQLPVKPQTLRIRIAGQPTKLVEWEIYICGTCFFKLDELAGDRMFGIPAKFAFERLPIDFRCPSCNAPKSGFFPAHCIAWA